MPPQEPTYESTPEEIRNEKTPLVSRPREGRSKKCCRCGSHTRKPVIVAIIVVVFLAGIFLYIAHPKNGLNRQIKEAQAQVHISKNGYYSVKYTKPTNRNMTFAELAHRMLPPWYEASLMAIDAVLRADTMKSSGVSYVRKTLLMTRSLLDAFSPVFSKHSLWKKVRKQFMHGYEIVGYYQDLNHSGVEYSEELWEKRKQDVLDWKSGFDQFRQQNNVRHLLYLEISPDECTRQKSSHLFWDEMKKLPCGHDLATASLQHLGQIQLTHAAEYYEIIQGYDSVLEEDRQENYHNLRKELRIFVNEYDLFGDVLVKSNHTASSNIHTLDRAQKKLGHINDKWEAYHIYETHNSHPEKQQKVEDEIQTMWHDFLKWAQKHDLEGTIQLVLGLLQ